MLKTLKHKIRGFIAGFICATVVWAFVLAPHTSFKISASNQSVQEQVAEDTTVNMSTLMPPVKPKAK